MILTLLSSSGENVHIEISADQFMQLRDPDITTEEVETIAASCGVSAAVVSAYVKDLKKSAQETEEIDGSCDYSDHM